MVAAVPPVAATLGYAGAVPFLVGATGVALAHLPATPLLAYGAVILAFMGGVHWGLGMPGTTPDAHRLCLSVVPALLAWAALILGGRPGLVLLAAAFVGLLALDLATTRRGVAPSWYPALRVPLTAVVVASLLLAAALTS
jgi:hypothetical protein